jgi:4a-hydroxytetrahydrobiopterin dehydratase
MATKALSDTEITSGLSKLTGWERDGDSITKTYKFETYPDGLAFASAAGIVSDGKDHHPDILIGWKKVTLTFTTHDAGSKISQHDLDTAAAVEALGFPKAK